MSQGSPTRILTGLTTDEIKELVAEATGEKPFRGKQAADWLYRKTLPDQGGGANSQFAGMTDLPASLRKELATQFELIPLSLTQKAQDPRDGTIKIVAALSDGPHIESVLMPDQSRVSVCLSTQAGCPMACSFCATGTQGLARNLTAGEIVAQFLLLQSLSPRRVTHVVFMGMGEPLLNLPNTLRAIRILNEEIGIAMRHITVSTVGVLHGIEKLAQENLQITLAVSLHAPNDTLRAQIVPVHRTYNLKKLMETCRRYFEITGRRVTFEYILLRGVNDNPKEAEQLARLLAGFGCAVNLIPYNPTTVAENYQRPEPSRIRAFRHTLESAGITVTQRKERGQKIAAACGQLVTERFREPATARPLPVYEAHPDHPEPIGARS